MINETPIANKQSLIDLKKKKRFCFFISRTLWKAVQFVKSLRNKTAKEADCGPGQVGPNRDTDRDPGAWSLLPVLAKGAAEDEDYLYRTHNYSWGEKHQCTDSSGCWRWHCIHRSGDYQLNPEDYMCQGQGKRQEEWVSRHQKIGQRQGRYLSAK